MIRVALAQMDPLLGQNPYNRERALAHLEEASRAGARLVLFPECAISGYGFASPEEAWPHAEPVPGPTTEAFAAACRARDLYAVVGLLERADGRLFNTAVLIGPEGLIGRYRKAHRPYLGVDRFTAPGDTGFPVFETAIGRIGMLICYDLRFPEAARVLALRGADLVAVPTNWPEGSEIVPIAVAPTRAMENRVFVLTCNRVGTERGFTFFGRSGVYDPAGRTLVQAGGEESLVTAEIDPLQARHKRMILRPGAFEMDPIGDRRPDLYGELVRGS